MNDLRRDSRVFALRPLETATLEPLADHHRYRVRVVFPLYPGWGEADDEAYTSTAVQYDERIAVWVAYHPCPDLYGLEPDYTTRLDLLNAAARWLRAEGRQGCDSDTGWLGLAIKREEVVR